MGFQSSCWISGSRRYLPQHLALNPQPFSCCGARVTVHNIFLVALAKSAPAIIYISVNKTIRKRVIAFIVKHKKATINLTNSTVQHVWPRNDHNLFNH
uniref:Uncharacterized protein n=1 Tax=Panagrolaimus sp. JU765 TaxID=591449 RepID=A0AC34QFK0_9BILA